MKLDGKAERPSSPPHPASGRVRSQHLRFSASLHFPSPFLVDARS